MQLILLAGKRLLKLKPISDLEVGQRFWWVTDDMKPATEPVPDDVPSLAMRGRGTISARDSIIVGVHNLKEGVVYDILTTEATGLGKNVGWEQLADAPWSRVIKAPL